MKISQKLYKRYKKNYKGTKRKRNKNQIRVFSSASTMTSLGWKDRYYLIFFFLMIN